MGRGDRRPGLRLPARPQRSGQRRRRDPLRPRAGRGHRRPRPGLCGPVLPEGGAGERGGGGGPGRPGRVWGAPVPPGGGGGGGGVGRGKGGGGGWGGGGPGAGGGGGGGGGPPAGREGTAADDLPGSRARRPARGGCRS